jgi:molybdopterin-guanine dinucleotide biosynthesis protein A
MEMMEITCAILAGGRSLRMGRDKATIPIGNRLLVSRVYDVARTIFDRILIVSNHHTAIEGVDAPIVPDVLPQRSPMVGIVSALLHAATPYVFVLGCDMPFVEEEAIRFVAGQAFGYDIVIPKTEKGYQPLHAVYSRATISQLLTHIERGRFRIPEVFPFVTVHIVEGPGLSEAGGFSIFTNLNTEEDLARARTRLR